ncbi:MAG: hypothetical protein ACOC6F_04235, partial [bacterium]
MRTKKLIPLVCDICGTPARYATEGLDGSRAEAAYLCIECAGKGHSTGEDSGPSESSTEPLSDFDEPEDNLKDRWGVVANYIGDGKISAGAKCWVLLTNHHHAFDRVKVRCKSRGGRKIEAWVRG